jgi:hypothetical protein
MLISNSLEWFNKILLKKISIKFCVFFIPILNFSGKKSLGQISTFCKLQIHMRKKQNVFKHFANIYQFETTVKKG